MTPEQIYDHLGQRIRGLRKGLGLTQEELARQVGVSRASLANMEAGRQQVFVHHLFAIADALQLDSPSQLLLAEQSRKARRAGAAELPLPGEGLTEKQRREVLSLMGDGFIETKDGRGEAG